jgi:ApaG protein
MFMVSQTTLGIRISVNCQYQEIYSRPEQRHYFFSYRITIENTSDQTVKLLRRHWHIFDSAGSLQEVEGEGVVGQQPVIGPGESYSYESASTLNTDIGSMHGSYLMRRELDGTTFEVAIPEFNLVVDYRLN